MNSFYQHIYGADDITIAIEKLIEMKVQEAIDEYDSDNQSRIDELEEQLCECRETIADLRSEIDDKDEEINRMLAKEGC